jgi:hypothetical protein
MSRLVRSALALAFVCAPLAGRASAAETCSGGVPSGPLADAIEALREEASSPSACPVARSCQSAVRTLDSALLGLCQQRSRALSQLGAAVQGLERAGLLASSGALRSAVENAADEANELVGDEREDVLENVSELCSGVRLGLRQGVAKPESSFALAQVQLGNDQWSLALRSLATAASGYESAKKRVASSALRCQPRACRLKVPVQFTPGAPGNDALPLVLPDRGTVARYQLTGDALDGIGSFDGTLALRFDGLLRARVVGGLDFPDLGGSLTLTGTFSTTPCLDGNGWVHYASVSEQLTLRAQRSAQLRGSARATPPSVSLPPTVFLPAVPAALVLRVGDEVVEPSVVLDLSIDGSRGTADCSASHRVVDIEEVSVPAGTFDAARISSSWDCVSLDGPLHGTAVAWIASEVGLVEYHFTSAQTGLWDYELACLEAPETAGSCGAP